MHIVVSGATGVIGRATVPRLLAAGHRVVGLHHHPAGATWLRQAGADPRQVDLFDPAAVRSVVDGADAVIHLATAIPPLSLMNKSGQWAMNDRLRTDATGLIVEAATQHAVPRVVVESITFNYVDRGDHWIAEDDAVDPVFRATASALVAEQLAARFSATGGIGVSLRFAQLYGPGRASQELVDALRHRKVPQVGDGTNYVSSIHVTDAAAAVLAALSAPSGIYNVADDAPMRAKDRLRVQADVLDAPAPRRIPTRIARLLVGPAIHQLTVSQRVLNRRFRETTGWAPAYPSLRDGWPSVAAPAATDAAFPHDYR